MHETLGITREKTEVQSFKKCCVFFFATCIKLHTVGRDDHHASSHSICVGLVNVPFCVSQLFLFGLCYACWCSRCVFDRLRVGFRPFFRLVFMKHVVVETFFIGVATKAPTQVC